MSFRIFIKKGNDLITPKPNWDFPGLKAGDKWCLCVSRWKEAEKLMWLQNRFECNTSIGIRICIIRIITTVFYLRRSAINSATDRYFYQRHLKNH
jgi:hypothetical protein